MTEFQTIHDLETPSILIDMDIVERNIAATQQLCDDLGMHNRPHIKTHKIPALAQKQLAAGAIGIACQKVSEAEIFADAGITDIQITYNIVGDRKLRRLAELAKRVKITVTADSLPVIEGLAQAAKNAETTIHVLVEVVSVNKRTGVPFEQMLTLIQRVLEHDNLYFAGVMFYPTLPDIRPQIQEALTLLEAENIAVETVSGGSSGLVLNAKAVPELTEIRMGTYIFWDWRSVTQGWATFDDCAMKIRATVVSAHDPSRVILDSGSKTLNAETLDGRYGYIVEHPEAKIYKLNEEHGYVDFSETGTMPQVGDILHIIPVHTCVVTNLHNRLYAHRGEAIETIYDVAARGLVW